MVDFGLIDSWELEPGNLTMWAASSEAVRRAALAPPHPTPPSHQQQDYLEVGWRDRTSELRHTSVIVASLRLPDHPDYAAMTRTINSFLRRHDTFSSWFSIKGSGGIERHVIDPDTLDFVSTDHGWFDSPKILREYIQSSTPGPFEWNCFSFGLVAHEQGSTFYFATDHLHGDGISLAIFIRDIAMLYWRETGMYDVDLPPAGSHLDFCERERRYTAQLTLSSSNVRRWLELIRGNEGRMPSFPLDLGVSAGSQAGSSIRTIRLFGESDTMRFAQACREHGARTSGGIFAIAALVERELAGSDYYFGLTPISARTTEAALNSMGWYATLVPVAFPLGARPTFARLAARAQHAYEAGKELLMTSPHRVVELASDEPGLDLRPGWAAPMISYYDVRHFAAATALGPVDMTGIGLHGSRTATEEVLIWISRLPEDTWLSVMYPTTPAADDAVQLYLKTFRMAFEEVISGV